MIVYIPENTCCPQCIQFDEKGKMEILNVISRGINTQSPPNPEMINLYDSLRESFSPPFQESRHD